MSAVVRVLAGPAWSGKTSRLIARGQELLSEYPGSVLWLVPTRRSAEALRERLAAETRTGWCAAVTTFPELADTVIATLAPDWRPVTNAQRRLLVEDLLAGAQVRGDLASFQDVVETRGFGAAVAALFAELQREAIEPPEFAHAVSQLYSEEGDTLRKAGRYAGLYAEYLQLLQRRRLVDFDGRTLFAARLLEPGTPSPWDSLVAIFVDGFAALPRSYLHLFRALGQKVRETWITLPAEIRSDREELFRQPAALRQFLNDAEEIWLPDPSTASPSMPAGLLHVERELFRPIRAVRPAGNVDGIQLLQAPGLLGEARLVARRIKLLLLQGVPAHAILVTMRDLQPYADLLREVFGEYGIPLDMEGVDPLLRSPVVSTLLRALRLPDEDWPFGGVTALLRSGYFQPNWPEAHTGGEIAQRAEVLLRLLGEPRGRETYLAAVRRWAESPVPGLEDEQAEESRRRKIHELAAQCRTFLERFFQAWDAAPVQAPLAEHLAWLRRLAEDLGFCAAATHPREATALGRLWDELDHWRRLDALLHGERPRTRKEFLRGLWTLAGEVGIARTPRGPGRVRVLSAEMARHLPADHLFVMGLGERSFPSLSSPDLVLDEQERLALRRAGLELPSAADAMPEEMLLFYEVVTRARRQLVLSYPAVDEKGQALLPSSFLAALLEAFERDIVPVERRSMLLEGFARDRPLAPAEYRVRTALMLCQSSTVGRISNPSVALGRIGNPSYSTRHSRLAPDLAANLAAAQRLVQLRLLSQEFSPYEGSFRDPAVLAELQQLYGPQKVFSPTALEDYVACPFRFFLGNVLRLAPLEGPREEIEVTRRGQAFHRALARLHQHMKSEGILDPVEGVGDQLRERLGEAVAEYAARASSPASKELWRLEGERLKRLAERYGKHWHKFREPWLPLEVVPRPYDFEVDFGLPASDGRPPAGPLVIRVLDVEVRVSGRIDRIDIAELEDGIGYWVIDYKTGRASHYTGTDLVQYRRLQLTLYALAIEQVGLAGTNARPLGMAYWLVGDKGPKVVLPAKDHTLWFEETSKWREVREELQQWIVTLVTHIRQGVFPLKPRSDDCTQTCDFGQVCRITQSRGVVKSWELPLPKEATPFSGEP